MSKRKAIRTRGKLRLSDKFQEFEENQSVAIVFEQSSTTNVPSRMQGRTGKVLGKRGSYYVIEVYDQKKPKQFIIDPIHLKKIQTIKKQ